MKGQTMLMMLNKQFPPTADVPGYALVHTGHDGKYYNQMVATYVLAVIYQVAHHRETIGEPPRGLLRLPGTDCDLVCSKADVVALTRNLAAIADSVVKAMFVGAYTDLSSVLPTLVVRALQAMAKTGVGVTLESPVVKHATAKRIQAALDQVKPDLPDLPIEEAKTFIHQMSAHTYIPLRHGIV